MSAAPGKRGLSSGVAYVWRGFQLIRQPGIRMFVAVPLAINVILFSLGLVLLSHGVEAVMDRFLPDWLDWLRYVLWPLLFAAALLIVFYTFSLLANLIASPFNGFLAAAVERHLRGHEQTEPFSAGALAREVARTFRAEIRKLLYFALRAIPCLVLFVVPGVNLVAAPVWFLFGAWMLAIEYVDCPLGNHGRPFPAARDLLRERRRLALGFGVPVMGLTMIPIVNFVAMPVAVAAATAMYVDELAPANAIPQSG